MKTKKNNRNSLRKHWKKENETEPEKDRLGKDEDGIVFDRDALMGQRATIGRACSRTAEQEEVPVVRRRLLSQRKDTPVVRANKGKKT